MVLDPDLLCQHQQEGYPHTCPSLQCKSQLQMVITQRWESQAHGMLLLQLCVMFEGPLLSQKIHFLYNKESPQSSDQLVLLQRTLLWNQHMHLLPLMMLPLHPTHESVPELAIFKKICPTNSSLWNKVNIVIWWQNIVQRHSCVIIQKSTIKLNN